MQNCSCTAKVGRGTVKVERNQDTGKTGPRQGTVRVDRRSSTARKQAGDDQAYFNVTGYPFPLGPITKRATIRKDIVRGIIWGFEQPQSLGGSNVTTNVRMTIVRLKSGGLWVHAPIAPTRECVRMVRQLENETGEAVKYIVLPTFGYEHKIFVGPFSRRFPKAEVWVAPSQWSWPINLPVQFFGIFPTGVLVDGAVDTPWADELEQKVFESSVGIGPYIEAAFFHKATRTLLVTDAVISVPANPPELVPTENLLEAAARNFFIDVLAGDLAAQPVDGVPLQPKELTPAARKLGWQRMALQILYIVPSDLRDPRKGFLAVAERLIVGPILKTLVFSTTPEVTRTWVDSICRDWAFTSIIPAHFTAPIRAGPTEFKAAFSFVYEPQLSAEQASGKAATPAAAAAKAVLATERKQESANPAKVLDGLLVGLLGGLSSSSKKEVPAPPPRSASSKTFQYPEEDIAALNAAKRFLVSAGVVNK
ncbi:hypothetical protein CHLNCDRAFT_140272 [Chlorella variabilis]|uniref:DUF4336 domain-containing protein n=1 Tax=Chlorella variabilis TaxID=554065 RepID=E1Z6M9_CHLVA|nr:hypothetical protein CHLNCDRAFT_140272 [Chlorella variabilis]EFN58377.1 hypothetical protein CHLNCDRAFT_140272 [Chlorella variabilis]|eukprot:XP_005850479.1 hypothetical protein CHLNCDRAFT_140272 [Chlorella variabilis]